MENTSKLAALWLGTCLVVTILAIPVSWATSSELSRSKMSLKEKEPVAVPVIIFDDEDHDEPNWHEPHEQNEPHLSELRPLSDLSGRIDADKSADINKQYQQKLGAAKHKYQAQVYATLDSQKPRLHPVRAPDSTYKPIAQSGEGKQSPHDRPNRNYTNESVMGHFLQQSSNLTSPSPIPQSQANLGISISTKPFSKQTNKSKGRWPLSLATLADVKVQSEPLFVRVNDSSETIASKNLSAHSNTIAASSPWTSEKLQLKITLPHLIRRPISAQLVAAEPRESSQLTDGWLIDATSREQQASGDDAAEQVDGINLGKNEANPSILGEQESSEVFALNRPSNSLHLNLRINPEEELHSGFGSGLRVSDLDTVDKRHLLITQRGLVVAAKRAQGLQLPSKLFNASALFVNQLDHSLSPVRVTSPPLELSSTSVSDQVRPSFLRKPALVSSIIWRNTTRRPQEPTYELIGDSPPFFVVPHRANLHRQTHRNPTNSSLDAQRVSTSETGAKSTVLSSANELDGRLNKVNNQTANTTNSNGTNGEVANVQNHFQPNPPYRQQMSTVTLDMASTQQLVAEFDQKNLTRQRQKQAAQAIKQRPSNPTWNQHSQDQVVRNQHNGHSRPHTNQLSAFQGTSSPIQTNNGAPYELSSNETDNQLHTTFSNQSNASSNITKSKPSTNNNAKLRDKIQHMIIGKILKNQTSTSNSTISLNSSFQISGSNSSNNGTSPTTSATSSTTSTTTSIPPTSSSSSSTQSPYTPAPLISSTVASNVANLIAQRINSLFVKPMSAPLSGSFISSSSSSTGSSGLASNLVSSFFGHRAPPSSSGGGLGYYSQRGPNKMKQRLSPLVNAASHSTVNRRTASMGSLLVSGLIYGLSVLPALMALTGINPLSSNSNLKQPQMAASKQVTSSQISPGGSANLYYTTSRPVGQRKQTVSSRSPPPTPSTHPLTLSITSANGAEPTASANTVIGSLPVATSTYTYLVPVVSTVSGTLDDVDFLGDRDSVSSHVAPVKSLYSSSDSVIEPSESIQFINSLNPTHISHFTSDHPFALLAEPELVQANQPYYAHPFSSAANYLWPDRTDSGSILNPFISYPNQRIGWPNQQDSATSNNNPSSPRPLTVPESNQPVSNVVPLSHEPLTESKPTKSSPVNNKIANNYKVGYTLNYKPVPVETKQSSPRDHKHSKLSHSKRNRRPQHRHQLQHKPYFIEFQDVDDLGMGSMSQWKPITTSDSSSGGARYNLNKSYKEKAKKAYGHRIRATTADSL